MGAERMTGGEHAMRLAIVWIDFNRLLQECLRDDVVLACYSPKVGESSHHQIPSVQAVGWFALSTKVFRGVDLRLDGSDYRLSCTANMSASLRSYRSAQIWLPVVASFS